MVVAELQAFHFVNIQNFIEWDVNSFLKLKHQTTEIQHNQTYFHPPNLSSEIYHNLTSPIPTKLPTETTHNLNLHS